MVGILLVCSLKLSVYLKSRIFGFYGVKTQIYRRTSLVEQEAVPPDGQD